MRVDSGILGAEGKVTHSVNVLPDNERILLRAAHNGMCSLILHFRGTSRSYLIRSLLEV